MDKLLKDKLVEEARDLSNEMESDEFALGFSMSPSDRSCFEERLEENRERLREIMEELSQAGQGKESEAKP